MASSSASPSTSRPVVLVIGGGIAAIKAYAMIRLLDKSGFTVDCVMRASAGHFVTPLSLQALSRRRVWGAEDLFGTNRTDRDWPAADQLVSDGMEHIHLSRRASIVLVAPASANILASIALGLADDLATTLILASRVPLLIAPAMNPAMWDHPSTRRHLAQIKADGGHIISPDKGHTACGETGFGRMAEPEHIVQTLLATIQDKADRAPSLTGLKALVTSGPTIEPLDPVRYISNRSSGRQGHALAQALSKRGATTTLVSGPVDLPDPAGVKTVHVEQARQMLAACSEHGKNCDIVICAAAVADWHPVESATNKRPKSANRVIKLAANPDILAHLARSNQRATLVIGFAAQTDADWTKAEDKRQTKGCDWMVYNNVANGGVIGQNSNQVTLLRDSGPEPWPNMPKEIVAQRLVDQIVDHFAARP